jgi:glycosyltransferase involved in cell wall biosynthesis
MPDAQKLSAGITSDTCHRKVLVVANSFPASGGSRIDKFVSLLPEFGFEPVVLSAKECDSPAQQELKQRYYPDTLKSFHARSIGWSYFTERFLMRGPRSRHYRLLQLLSFPERSLLVPDYMVRWIPHGIRVAKEIVKREGVQVILTSSPHESTHLIGLSLKNSLGIPWVADFRDLWIEKTLLYRPATRWHDIWIRRLERKVFHTADFVIANTPENADRYRKRFRLPAEKLEVIPNGFDRNDLNPEYQPRLTPGVFRIGYAGALDKHEFPWRAALDALKMLAEDVGRDKVRLVHCGYLSKQVCDYLQAHKLEDLVEIHGTLPHSDAVTLTASTDIRLLLLYETAYSSSIVPMKLYNYLIMNGPILALAPESGMTASIITKTRMGCVISPRRGIETIYRQLLEYYQAWMDGCLSVNPDDAEIQRYDRHAQTGRLAEILTTVAEPRKQDQREVSTHHE